MEFDGIGTGVGGGVIAFVLLQMFYYLIKQLRNRKNGMPSQLNQISDALKDIKDAMNQIKETLIDIKSDGAWTRNIHDKYTDDGSPKWYFPAALKEMLTKLLEATQTTNQNIRELTGVVERLIKAKE